MQSIQPTNAHDEATASQNNHETSTELSPGSLALTKAELDLLAACGSSEAEIQELNTLLSARTKTAKKESANIPALLAARKDELLASGGNKPLWTARAVADATARLGYYKVVRGANAFGDALGHKGHNLPCVGNPKLYDLSSIGTTDEQKMAVQEKLAVARREVIKAMTAQVEVNATNGEANSVAA